MPMPVTMMEHMKDIRSRQINYKSLHTTAILTDESTGRNIEIPWDSITRKYRDRLMDIRSIIQLSDDLMERYKFSPKRVSQELYGTTELWADILAINNCGTLLDFVDIRNLIIYDPRELKSLINEIMVLESKL